MQVIEKEDNEQDILDHGDCHGMPNLLLAHKTPCIVGLTSAKHCTDSPTCHGMLHIIRIPPAAPHSFIR